MFRAVFFRPQAKPSEYAAHGRALMGAVQGAQSWAEHAAATLAHQVSAVTCDCDCDCGH